MRRRPGRHKHRLGTPVALAATAAALLIAIDCRSLQAAEASGSIDSVLKMMNLKADPGQPQPFVEQSRPGQTDYVPVGKRHGERVIKRKSAADVKAAETELDTARARQEKAVAQPVPTVTPAASGKPGKAPLRGTQN